jgi:hypothetical protein
MQSSIPTVSPLRQRMVDDMRMRRLSPKTQSAYIRAVGKFTKFLGHSPPSCARHRTGPPCQYEVRHLPPVQLQSKR